MNTIQVAIKIESGTDDSQRCLTAEVLLDGRLVAPWTEIPVDMRQLVASTQKSGAYFIWNCSCGFPECTGIETGVDVRHAPPLIHWRTTDPPFEQPVEVTFDQAAYCAEVNRAWQEYVATYQACRAAGIEFDLCPWVPDAALPVDLRSGQP